MTITSPSNLTVDATTSTSATLTFQDDSDTEDGFIVERREQFRDGFGSWRKVVTLDPNSATGEVEFTDDSALPNTTYEWRVTVFDGDQEATSDTVQATTADDGVSTDRVPAQGWHVIVEDDTGNVYTPDVVGTPSFNPTLNGLPTVEVPVATADRWAQPQFEEATMRVYLDGDRLPIDTLVAVDRSETQSTLRGRGGSALRERVERSYLSKAVHTASEELIATVGYDVDVDVPATETLTDETLQSADTTTDLQDNLLTTLPATEPIEITNGAIQLQQTCFVTEGEDEDRGSAGTSTRLSDYSAGAAGTVGTTGEYAEFDVTPAYDIPAEHVGLAVKDWSDDLCGVEWTFNGDVVDSVTAGAGGTTDSWTQLQDSFYDGDGYGGGDLAAGTTYTFRIECTNGGGSGEFYDFDVVAVFDTRYNYTWDETVDADGYLSGPELYPASVDVVMDDAVTAYSVTAADLSSTWDDTSNNQQVAVSNDFGNSWSTADNAASLSSSFAERGGTVRARFRLSRYGSRSTATPTTGIQGQSVDAYTLSADLDDVATLVNRSYDGRVSELLTEIAEFGDLTWEVRWNDGYEVIVTRPGLRTSSAAATLTDYSVTKDASEIVTRAVVYGKAQPVAGESVAASHKSAVELAEDHLVETSEVVRDPSTGTSFARGVDYTIDEQAGMITTLAAGSIQDSQTLEVDYEHRSRGVFESDAHDGDPTHEIARTIPAATTDRACEQAALKIVQTADEPRWTADVTVDAAPPDVPLSTAIDLDQLPTRDEVLEVWDVTDEPGGVSMQLGNRDQVSEVVDDIRSRLEAVARLS